MPSLTGGIFRCPECSTVLLSSSDMARHCQNMHKEVYTFVQCCDEVFFTKPTYEKHCAQQHATPLTCPQCHKAFPTKTELAAHKMAYTKVYVCPMCGSETGTMTTMRGHIESKHAVIIDPRYVIVKTIKSDTKRRRSRVLKHTIWRKFLQMTLPCCIWRDSERSIFRDYFPFACRFDDESYSCRSLDRNCLARSSIGLYESQPSNLQTQRHLSEAESTSLSFD